MGNVLRTAYASFTLEDDYVFDAVSLLHGVVPAPARTAQIIALAVLTGERHRITPDDWEILTSIPSDRWVEEEQFDRRVVRRLLDMALLVSDTREGPLNELRERDAALTANSWHPHAALYHFATQWSGVTIDDGSDAELAAQTAAAVRELVAEYGPAPEALSHVSGATTISLPARVRPEPFYRTLSERRTTRTFDLERPMSLDDLNIVLRYVFGCHGYAGRGRASPASSERAHPPAGSTRSLRFRSSAMSKGLRPVYTTTTRMIIPWLFSKNRLASGPRSSRASSCVASVTLAKLTFRSCWQQDSTAITGSIVDTHGPTRGFSWTRRTSARRYIWSPPSCG